MAENLNQITNSGSYQKSLLNSDSQPLCIFGQCGSCKNFISYHSVGPELNLLWNKQILKQWRKS